MTTTAPGGSEVRPLSLRALAWLYDCEAENTRVGRHGADIFEPLDLPAVRDARPSCCYISEVWLYSSDGNTLLGKTKTHDMNHPFPLMLRLSDGRWYERASGRVTWYRDRWYMKHTAYANTRTARWLNGAAADA